MWRELAPGWEASITVDGASAVDRGRYACNAGVVCGRAGTSKAGNHGCTGKTVDAEAAVP